MFQRQDILKLWSPNMISGDLQKFWGKKLKLKLLSFSQIKANMEKL